MAQARCDAKGPVYARRELCDGWAYLRHSSNLLAGRNRHAEANFQFLHPLQSFSLKQIWPTRTVLILYSSVCQHFELLAGFHVISVYNRSFANSATNQPTRQAQTAMAALAQA